MPRRTREDAEKTRKQILDAALKIFSIKGYSKTTFVDIAKEIGLSKGAVYWHFKTKTDLLVAVIAYGDEKFCLSVKSEMSNSLAELRDKVQELSTFYTSNQHAWNFEFFCHYQIEWSTEMMTEVHERLKELRGEPVKDFAEQLAHLQEIGVLKREMNAQFIALSFGASWIGTMNLAMCGDMDRKSYVKVLLTSFDLIVGSQAIV